ncbi:MAG TPA: hypothetical protein VJ697_13170 [Nitrososphaeraceae archaeon]|nr:hypothetical protein [Nitrososphaeraceae archaeon]
MSNSNTFGRYTTLNNEPKNSRTILISENLFLKLKGFSRRNNVETYENAINYLLEFWNNNNSEYTPFTRY